MHMKTRLQVCQEQHLKWEGGSSNCTSQNMMFLMALLMGPAVGQTDADSEL